MADDAAGFLARWSRRKALVRQGVAPVEPAAVPTAAVPAPAAARPATIPMAPPATPPATPLAAPPAGTVDAPAPPLPTLADVAGLGPDSDYSRFVAPGVDGTVKNAALKQLFTDPHFNVMDGLDTYIDDYGRPDPLPPGLLRELAQSRMLGLFDDDPAAPAAAGPPTLPTLPTLRNGAAPLPADPEPPAQALPDEDPALRLQPHDAAGPSGADRGAGPDTGHPHGRA